jgi:hypothetical protein
MDCISQLSALSMGESLTCTRRQPDRSGEQPGSAAGSGEAGHAVSVMESPAGGQGRITRSRKL